MKHPSIILAIFIFLIALLQPVPITLSQQPVEAHGRAPLKITTPSELKSAILANLDTINTLIDKKIITLKKQNTALKKKYHQIKNNSPPIIHDTLIIFIDTCIKNIDYQLIKSDSTITPEKIGWFKKLFKKKHR